MYSSIRKSLSLVNILNKSSAHSISNFKRPFQYLVNLPITPIRLLSAATTKKTVTIHIIDRDGEKIEVKAAVGSNLLDVAIDNNIDLEGFGACEGTLSCSTCHLILEEENYKQLKPPSDEENDMLDLAYGLKDTSRLGCQIIVQEKMNGWKFVVPKEVNDARA